MSLTQESIKNGANLNEKLLELFDNAPEGTVLSEVDVFRLLEEMGVTAPADQENVLMGADLDYCFYAEQQKPLGDDGDYTCSQNDEHLRRLDVSGLVGDARDEFYYRRRGQGEN